MDEDTLVFDLLSEIFKSNNFENIITKSSENEVHCRTNVANEGDLKKWKELYYRETKTYLNVTSTSIPSSSQPQRRPFCQRLICQFANKRHKGVKNHYTGCPFRMKIKIERSTAYMKETDEVVRSHPCLITISGVHNHNAGAETPREFRVLPEVKEAFNGYFRRGMTRREARRYHRLKMDLVPDISAEQAGGDKNPTPRASIYMFERWARNSVLGYNDDTMLDELRRFAAQSDSVIEVERDGRGSVCAALVTPLMRRAHALSEAGQGVFVDSTASVGRLDTAVVLLLCSSPAGALPLGVVFASPRTEDNLANGFWLLQKAAGDSAFGGCRRPAAFITSCGDAERRALRSVWPAADQFLCALHCLRQAWQWLTDSRISKQRSRSLIGTARELVHAPSLQEFQTRLRELRKTRFDFARFLQDIIAYPHSWLIAYPHSQGALQGYSANSYMAATACIARDLVMNRCNARHVCELVMAMDELYNGYMVQRLVDIAYNRRRSMCLAPADVPENSITRVDEHQFRVMSEEAAHEVMLDAGLCSCPKKKQPNGICKHQTACSHVVNLEPPQTCVLTPEIRHWFVCLAVGEDKAPDVRFFAHLTANRAASERNDGGDSDSDSDSNSDSGDRDDSGDDCSVTIASRGTKLQHHD